MNHLFGGVLAILAVGDVNPAGDLTARRIDNGNGTRVQIGYIGFGAAQDMHVTGGGESPNRTGNFGRVAVDGEDDPGVVDHDIDRVAVCGDRLGNVTQRNAVGTEENIVIAIRVGDQLAIGDVVIAE